MSMKIFNYFRIILIITTLFVSSIATFSPVTMEAQSGHVQVKLDNPLGTTHDVPTLISKLLDIVLKIGVPLVVLAILWTGYLFIAARGKSEEITKAKESLKWTLIGALILLGAYAISEAVVGTINAIRS